uniref:Uncharacterized protein n=1 Tax=Pseudonaja textilis TaxID=8673 RepID=A0A670ZAA1_PSETE
MTSPKGTGSREACLLPFSAPALFSLSTPASATGHVCSNWHRLICKYAKDIGFIKVRGNAAE